MPEDQRCAARSIYDATALLVCSVASELILCGANCVSATLGTPCIPQFPATGGFPQCGSGSTSKVACTQMCKAPPPPAPPLPECPAFPAAGDPTACDCETFPPPLGCRGETPRFNWIVGVCDAPNSTNATENTLPSWLVNDPHGCTDPQRLQPEHAGPSNVSLVYVAAYQWGNPCDIALAAVCGGALQRRNATLCADCAGAHADALHAAGCSADLLAEACDPCGIALRAAVTDEPMATCGRQAADQCDVCMDGAQAQLPSRHRRACEGEDVGERLRRHCHRPKAWVLAENSSFNVEGSASTLELEKLRQPGGAHYWSHGYYTPHTPGLAPPGMLFVISCEVCSRFTWFALNQATLDRGPDIPTCSTVDNCWASGSAGELDFLETGFWEPAFYNNTTPDGGPNPNRNNSRLYATSYNGAGRCFPVNKGNNDPNNQFISAKSAGGACSSNYFVDDGLPHLYAAVVDRRGTTVYRDPVWGGLNRTSAARVLRSAAPEPPTVRTPPCNAGTGSCAISNPSCLFQEPFPPRLGAGGINYSQSELPCNMSSVPPAQEWGYKGCNDTVSSAAAAHPMARPGFFEASAVLPQLDSSQDGLLEVDEEDGRREDGRRGLQAATTYCCNSSAGGGNGSCTPFPHPGKLCFDRLCDKAKDMPTCQKTNSSLGTPCIPQFPAMRGFPECGIGSTSLVACQQQCQGKRPPGPPGPPGPPPPPPPPPPPAPPVYCCNCTLAACVEARSSGARFCSEGGGCNPHPPGKLCPDFSCVAGEGSAAACAKIKGCTWQGDANQSRGEVKCGSGSMGAEACAARCIPPPQPACSAKKNWCAAKTRCLPRRPPWR